MTVQLAKIDTRRRKLGGKALFGSRNAIGIYIPAKDPEHFLERNSGMVILVLGEMMWVQVLFYELLRLAHCLPVFVNSINAFYSATEESLGLSPLVSAISLKRRSGESFTVGADISCPSFRRHFGKAAFGLIIAFDLNWLFFCASLDMPRPPFSLSLVRSHCLPHNPRFGVLHRIRPRFAEALVLGAPVHSLALAACRYLGDCRIQVRD